MNLLIVENNFLLKENFFFQSDLKDNINLIFSSSIRSVKKVLNKKKFDFIIISSLAPKLNSFDVIKNGAERLNSFLNLSLSLSLSLNLMYN